MSDPEEIVRIEGVQFAQGRLKLPPGPRRRFLSVLYRCCHVYGRLYRNKDATAYVGRCPGCGGPVFALIGPGGTNKRLFEAN